MNEWITDRMPSQFDVNEFDSVIIPCNNLAGWKGCDFTKVKPGQPWAPFPTMPPYVPDPKYWSCPEDIPPNALWFLDYDGDCDMIQTVTSWGFFLAQNIKIRFDELGGWRWNDRPFSRFNDGNPCTKETNQ